MRPDTSAGSQGRAFVQTSGRSGIHLQGQLLSWSGRWVALVVGEVAEQLLARRALGDGVDQQLAADEGALPGRAPAPERLGLVAAGPRLVDADLEGVDLIGQLAGPAFVVAGD